MDHSEKIEEYYAKEHHFKEGISVLRKLALKANAEETFKWQAPVYGIGGKNVFWIARFKNHFGIGFFNGVFLSDPKNVLVNVQEGKTVAMRHWHFKFTEEVDESAVTAYILESLENQRKGLTLAPAKKERKKIEIPDFLAKALKNDPKTAKAFQKLSDYQEKGIL